MHLWLRTDYSQVPRPHSRSWLPLLRLASLPSCSWLRSVSLFCYSIFLFCFASGCSRLSVALSLHLPVFFLDLCRWIFVTPWFTLGFGIMFALVTWVPAASRPETASTSSPDCAPPTSSRSTWTPSIWRRSSVVDLSSRCSSFSSVVPAGLFF